MSHGVSSCFISYDVSSCLMSHDVSSCLMSQGHSPAGLLMGLTVGTVTITMGQNAGASMNPAADVMPRSGVTRDDDIMCILTPG